MLRHFHVSVCLSVWVCVVCVCVCVCMCLSVCFYVTHMLCMKTAKRFVKIFLPPDSLIIPIFYHWGLLRNSDGFTSNGGGEKIGRFLTNNLVYLGNGARYSHSCYRSWIRNHTQVIDGGTFDDIEWPHPPVSRSPCSLNTLVDNNVLELLWISGSHCGWYYTVLFFSELKLCSAHVLTERPICYMVIHSRKPSSGWWLATVLAGLPHLSAWQR